MSYFKKSTNLTHAFLITVLMVLPLLLFAAYYVNKHYLYARTANELDNLIEVFISNLKGEIEKFSFLPDVLSADPDISKLMNDPDNQELVEIANYKLEQVNEVSKASDIYIMDPTGVTVAASNWQLERSFVGQNFSFRPYFKQAISGRQGRYFAYGTTSRQRGYYFSSPIYHDSGSIKGVIVVKVRMDRLEQAWKDYDMQILVADENSVVFSTNKALWQFAQLEPLSATARNKILNDKQYPLELLKPAQVDVLQHTDDLDLIKVALAGKATDYLRVSADMPELNWRVHGLQTSAPLQQSIYLTMAGVILVFVMLSALIHVIILRRRSLKEQLAYRLKVEAQLIEARDELEHRVMKRTRALTAANEDLQLEIDERQKAELELRQAQDELIHATRLATLGQLSAGITHELSQPLAAINSYADNAIAYLDNSNTHQVKDNLSDIIMVCERMAQITMHLKSFSRKTTDELEKVDLSESINNALALLNVRLRERDIVVNINIDRGILVCANEVRLEQVFVNIFNNALDAMEDVTNPSLVVSQEQCSDSVKTVISDNGSGIVAENSDAIFDPFFTTKEVGMGLGLGLSISHAIIKKFGGELTALNNRNAGASFSVKLLKWTNE